MALTNNDLTRAIREMELSGRVILLHSSLKSFGKLENGAETVIRSFIEEGCTVVVPTFFYDAYVRPPKGKEIVQNGFDYSKAPDINDKSVITYTGGKEQIVRDMGIIPKTLLKMKESVRGDHPLNSFSAVGPHAEEVISLQTPMAVYAPLKHLYSMDNAYIVLLGVDLTKATAIHLAEEMAGRRLFRSWAKTGDGCTVETEVGSCSEGFNQLEPHVKDIERGIRVGESLWRIFPFRPFIDKITAAIRLNPMITHCGEEDCLRCRDMAKGGPILI